MIYGSTTTAIANMISLDNMGPRAKPSCLRYSFSGLAKRKLPMQCTMSKEVYIIDKIENQVCILLHLQEGEFSKSYTSHLVSLNS